MRSTAILVSVAIHFIFWGKTCTANEHVEAVAISPRSEEIRQKQSDAMIKSASIGDFDTLKTFIAAGVDVNYRDKHGWSAILWASNYNYPAIVKHLIVHGADVEATDPDGRRVLAMAASNGHINVVHALISGGASIGGDAVVRAYLNGHEDVLEVLKANANGWMSQIQFWVPYILIRIFGDLVRSESAGKSCKNSNH